MTRAPKLLAKAVAKNKNLRFTELTALAEAFGFRLDRIAGSHHIYMHPDVEENLNLQNAHGKAKSYQYNLTLE